MASVQVFQGFKYLLDYVCNLSFVDNTFRVHHFFEVTSCDKLHDDVVAMWVLDKLYHTSYVRMVYFLNDGKFVIIQLLSPFIAH